MSTDLVSTLRGWFGDRKDGLAVDGTKAEYTEAIHEGAISARIDLESDQAFGRATVWETGYCDLEILSIENGEPLLFQHHEDVDGRRLVPMLELLARQTAKPT